MDGPDIYLIRAREALRSAEVKLTAQALALQAIEARASAIAGWAVVGTMAALAVIFGQYADRFQLAAILIAADLTCVGIVACLTLSPGSWATPGYEPAKITDGFPSDQTEAALLYSLVSGYGQGIRENSARLTNAARRLRVAIWWLGVAPLLGLAGVTIGRLAGY